MYSFMTEAERMDAYESALIDNAFMKLEWAFEQAAMNYRIGMSNIDAELYVRECSDAEMDAVYGRQVEIYTEGVKEIWEKVKATVVRIFNAILNKLGLLKPKKETVSVDVDGNKVVEIFTKIENGLKKAVNSCINSDGTINRPLFYGALGVGTFAAFKAVTKASDIKKAIVNAVKAPGKGVKMGVDAVLKLIGSLKSLGKGIKDSMCSLVDAFKRRPAPPKGESNANAANDEQPAAGTEGDDKADAPSFINRIFNAISSAFSSVVSRVTSALKGKNANTPAGEKDQNTETPEGSTDGEGQQNINTEAPAGEPTGESVQSQTHMDLMSMIDKL